MKFIIFKIGKRKFYCSEKLFFAKNLKEFDEELKVTEIFSDDDLETCKKKLQEEFKGCEFVIFQGGKNYGRN